MSIPRLFIRSITSCVDVALVGLMTELISGGTPRPTPRDTPSNSADRDRSRAGSPFDLRIVATIAVAGRGFPSRLWREVVPSGNSCPCWFLGKTDGVGSASSRLRQGLSEKTQGEPIDP